MEKRKAALPKWAFEELELYAIHGSCYKVGIIQGFDCDINRVYDSFFRIVNFGYDGMLSKTTVPKFEAELLCKMAARWLGTEEDIFHRNTPVTSEEFRSDAFVCGCTPENGIVDYNSDIRCLDLSCGVLRSILRFFNEQTEIAQAVTGEPVKLAFTVHNLLIFSEETIAGLEFVGAGGLERIKAELAQYGLMFGDTENAILVPAPMLSDIHTVQERIARALVRAGIDNTEQFGPAVNKIVEEKKREMGIEK